MKLWLERFIIGCLYAVLLTPLIFYQQLMSALVIVKAAYFQTLVGFAFAAYAALAARDIRYRPRVTPLYISVCALFAVIALSSAFGVNGLRSIWSVPERMTGIVFMGHVVAYFIMLSGMRAAFSWRRYLSVAVGVSFLAALFPVVQLIFPGIFYESPNDQLRLTGTIGNPIFLAAYLFLNIFLAAWLAVKTRAEQVRVWWLYAFVACFDYIVVLFTQTRGAFVASFVALAVFSAYATTQKNARRARYTVCAAGVALIVFGGIFWTTRMHSIWRTVPILNRVAVEGLRADNRLIAWRAGLQAFIERPVFGWGWENFYTAFNAHYDPRLLRSGFTETFFDRPHNVFVQFLAETGLIGIAAYIFLLACALYYARGNIWLVALLAAYVTQNFFAFDSISSYLLFFMALAFIDAEYAGKNSISSVPSARSGTISLSLLACTAALACMAFYYVTYRSYSASHLEWKSINYFVHGFIPEGIEYMDKALMASTPYHAYIAKDLYPNITFIYKQNIALPDVRALIARTVQGMTDAAEAEPLNYGFWIGLADMIPAIVPLDAKYLDVGIAALARAQALSPNRQATFYVRAKLLNLKGDTAGAQKAMADAVALDPQVGDAHFFYGLLLLEGGDKDGGVRELARARELGREPKNVNEARVAASALGDLGAYKESQTYYQRALLFPLEGDNLETIIKLGLVYYFDGQYDAARRLIRTVITKEDITRSPQYESLRPILRDLGLEPR